MSPLHLYTPEPRIAPSNNHAAGSRRRRRVARRGRPRPLIGFGTEVLKAIIADDLGLDERHRPATYWPGNRRVAAMLRDARPNARLPAATYLDEYDEKRRRWRDPWTDEAADRTDVVEVLYVYIGYGAIGDGAITLYARPTPRGIEWATRYEEDEITPTPRYTPGPISLDDAWAMLDLDWHTVAEDLVQDSTLTYDVRSRWYDVDTRFDRARAYLGSGEVPPDYVGRLVMLPGDAPDVWNAGTEGSDDPVSAGPGLVIHATSRRPGLARLVADRRDPTFPTRRCGPLVVPALFTAVSPAHLHRVRGRTRELVAWADPQGGGRLLEVAGVARTAWVLERTGMDAVLMALAAPSRTAAGRAAVIAYAGTGTGTPTIGPWSTAIRCGSPALRRSLQRSVLTVVDERHPWRDTWMNGLRERSDLMPTNAPDAAKVSDEELIEAFAESIN